MAYTKFTRLCLITGFILLVSSCTPPPPAPPINVETERDAIRALLDTQVSDWNDGNIDAFMTGYWQSESLRFASGNAFRQGWQETLERYKTSYPDKANMGELSFELYEINILSTDAAMVFGRFNLKREAALGDLTGLFTLIFRKHDSGWKIVHDHTSS